MWGFAFGVRAMDGGRRFGGVRLTVLVVNCHPSVMFYGKITYVIFALLCNFWIIIVGKIKCLRCLCISHNLSYLNNIR